MSGNNWIHLDDLRESWLFLLISCEQSDPNKETEDLDYWELGVGNADSLVETQADRIDREEIGSETELVRSLLSELDQYRYEDLILITPDKETLQLLRRKLAVLPATTSLRGFTHLVLEELLDDYFAQGLQTYRFECEDWPPPRITTSGQEDVVTTGGVKAFWELWQQVYKLIPASELGGEPL